MSDRVEILPTLTAETVRSWLLQVNKNLGPRQDERAVWQLEQFDRQAEEIIEKLKTGEENRGKLIEKLCQLREQRDRVKAALLLMLIAHMNILKTEGQREKTQEAWQKTIDKLSKDIRDIGSETVPPDTIDIGGFLHQDPGHKKILDTFADVLDALTEGDKPVSALGAKDKLELVRIIFDIATRWVPVPSGVGEFGGFFKFYSDSMKEIGKKLGELEAKLDQRTRDYLVTFDDVDFGKLINAESLQKHIEARVKLIERKYGREKALQIVHDAAKIRLLKAYHAAAFGERGLLNRLSIHDEVGKQIDRWASSLECLARRFRKTCDTSLDEYPPVYRGGEVQDIVGQIDKANDDELLEKWDRAEKADDRWFVDKGKRKQEIREVIDGKRGIDAWCADKTVREIESLSKEQKKNLGELAEWARDGETLCAKKRKAAAAAMRDVQSAEDKFRSAIDELKTQHRKQREELRKKHLPEIEKLEKAAEDTKASIEQAKKDALWNAADRDEKELSPLMDKALAADKEYFAFSEKYEPVRTASLETDLAYSKLLLRSKQGEKISAQELSALKAKSEELEKKAQEMQGTYEELEARREAAWKKYNARKPEVEAAKTKAQQRLEKQIKEKAEQVARYEDRARELRKKYYQEQDKLNKAQTEALSAKKAALQKEIDAKRKAFLEKEAAAQKVCQEAAKQKKKLDRASERARQVEAHLKRAKAIECVEDIVYRQIQSRLRTLEFIAKSERDIHTTLWSHRGLATQGAEKPGEWGLREKTLVLYGKCQALADLLDLVHVRENPRTHSKKGLPAKTRFFFKPDVGIMARLTRKDGRQDPQAALRDFRAAFGDLEKGLQKLQLTREHLVEELDLLRGRLANCLREFQTAEKELGRTDLDLFRKWESDWKERGGTVIERIGMIRSQEHNQLLADSITKIEEVFKSFEAPFKHYRPKILIKAGVKKAGRPPGEQAAPAQPPTGTEKVLRLKDELVRPPTAEAGSQVGGEAVRLDGGEAATPAQPPTGTEKVLSLKDELIRPPTVKAGPQAGGEAVGPTGGETATPAQPPTGTEKVLRLKDELIRPPTVKAGPQVSGEAAGPGKIKVVEKTVRAGWRTLGGEVSISGVGSVGLIPLLSIIALIGMTVLAGAIYGGYRLIEAVSGAPEPPPAVTDAPGTLEPSEAPFLGVETQEPVVSSVKETLDLRCGLTPDSTNGFLELSGPPNYWWTIFYSLEPPTEGAGDFVSSDVRLDLSSAYIFWFFEDEAEGYFDSTGQFYVEFIKGGLESEVWWFQAISVENKDILYSDPAREDVLLSPVCEIDFSKGSK